MKNELVVKQCKHCKSTVIVLKDSKLMCCNEEMEVLVPNSVDAAFEKHIPTYEVQDGKILVTVNHVMEEDHYIEWIAMCTDKKVCLKYFAPGEEAKTHFKYVPGSYVYSYCNKHGLWKTEIK